MEEWIKLLLLLILFGGHIWEAGDLSLLVPNDTGSLIKFLTVTREQTGEKSPGLCGFQQGWGPGGGESQGRAGWGGSQAGWTLHGPVHLTI